VPILAAVASVLVVVGIFIALGIHRANEREAERERIEATKDAIRTVIARDSELGNEMNSTAGRIKVQSEEDVDKIAQSIRNYVEQARLIDTSNCPREFADAYSRHVMAWSDAAATIRSHPHVPSGAEALVDVLTVLFTEDKSSVEHLENEASAWKQELDANHGRIQKTWSDVNAVAKRYGVE
jgi:hypothetical protein